MVMFVCHLLSPLAALRVPGVLLIPPGTTYAWLGGVLIFPAVPFYSRAVPSLFLLNYLAGTTGNVDTCHSHRCSQYTGKPEIALLIVP